MTSVLSGVRVSRVLAVGSMAFGTSLLLVMMVVFAYAFALGFQARGQPDQAKIERFAEAVAPWLGPLLASLLTAGGAAWISSRASERQVLHGLLVAAVVSVGVVAIEASQGFGAADVVKVAAILASGWIGSLLATTKPRSEVVG